MGCTVYTLPACYPETVAELSQVRDRSDPTGASPVSGEPSAAFSTSRRGGHRRRRPGRRSRRTRRRLGRTVTAGPAPHRPQRLRASHRDTHPDASATTLRTRRTRPSRPPPRPSRPTPSKPPLNNLPGKGGSRVSLKPQPLSRGSQNGGMTPIPSGSTGVGGLKDMREPPFRGTAPRTAVHSVGRTARADLAAPARADLAAVNILKTRAPGGPGAPSRTEGPQGSPRQTLVDVRDHVTDGEYGGVRALGHEPPGRRPRWRPRSGPHPGPRDRRAGVEIVG